MKRYIPILLILFLLSSTAMAQGRLRRAGDFIFHALTEVANLTDEKGMSIWYKDILEIDTGSASLNSINSENWNKDQFTILMWVKLYFTPGDGLTHQLISNNVGGGNGISAFIFTDGTLYFDVTDKDALLHRFSSSITGWSAGEWHQVVLRLDFKNDEAELYVDGASVDSTPTNPFSGDSIDAIESDTDIGHAAGSLQVNAATTLLIEGRSWSNAEITANYAAGAGTPFVVGPDTLALLNTREEDTSITYHHQGKAVSAITNSGTESSLTVPGGGDTSFVENDAVTVSAGTGDSKSGFVDDGVSGNVVPVDDGAGALVSDIEKVGVSVDFDDQYSAETANSGILNATTEDISVSFRAIIDDSPGGLDIEFINKGGGFGATNGWRISIFDGGAGGLTMFVQLSDGTDAWDMRNDNRSSFDGKWAHCAIVIDKDNEANSLIYINGVDTGATYVGTLGDVGDISSGDKLTLGKLASSGGFGFPGRIEDVKIYIAAGAHWSAAQVLYQATHPHDISASAGTITDSWDMDENTGTTINGAVNNLTLSNAAAWTQEAYISRKFNADGDMEDGGIGAYQVGDVASVISKSTTEIFKDTQSLKVLNGDASQAWARQTITTVTGADYCFFGRFFAPDTPNGASQLVDVDATAALGITVTQAGLSAGWNTVEFAFTAGDTSTTIDLGSGSVTNTEFGYWDDVEILENLIVNGGMEGTYDDESGGGGTVNVAPGWDKHNVETDGSDTLDEETTIVHSGSKSQYINVNGGDEGIIQTHSDGFFANSTYYTLSLWARVVSSGNNVRVQVNNGVWQIVLPNVNSWVRYSVTFKTRTNEASGFVDNVIIRSQAFGAELYIDDVTLVRLDTRAAATATKTPGYWLRRNPLSP